MALRSATTIVTNLKDLKVALSSSVLFAQTLARCRALLDAPAPIKILTIALLDQHSAWMVDLKGNHGAAGIGLDIHAGKRRVNSLKLGP